MHSLTRDQAITARPAGRLSSTGAHALGRALSVLVVILLIVDSVGKLLQVPPVITGTVDLGYPASSVFGLGVVELLCVAAYSVRRTSLLGALLLTGYLGGAVATHVRVGDPLFTHVLFPVYVASLIWGGLVLRDVRLQMALGWAPGDRASVDAETIRKGPMNPVISRDGTPIAWERSGSGAPVIVVDGALCSRAFGPSPKLAKVLAQRFTVYTYDRRGRGRSGDTQPFALGREVEDIAALIAQAGEPVSLIGLSSGGALALEAAASGLPIRRVVAYEPPFVDVDGLHNGGEHEPRLRQLVAAGDRTGAVKYFMKTMVGLPSPLVLMMRLMPWMWHKLEAVAHTLPYDAAVMNAFTIPTARYGSIGIPVLLANGSKTDPRIQRAARMVAEAIPGAQHVTLEGQTHNVNPSVLSAAIVNFFTN